MAQQAPAVPPRTCFKVFVIILLFLLIGCLFAFIFRSERSVWPGGRLVSFQKERRREPLRDGPVSNNRPALAAAGHHTGFMRTRLHLSSG